MKLLKNIVVVYLVLVFQNYQEIKQAANTLQNLLPRSQPNNPVHNNQQCFPRQGVNKAPNIQSQNILILQNRQSKTVSCHSEQEPEVFIENQVRNVQMTCQCLVFIGLAPSARNKMPPALTYFYLFLHWVSSRY